MARGKSKKKESEDIVISVMGPVHLGYNDSKIGRQLGIHRTTVKRYREKGEKRAIDTEARIRAIQESLVKHFDSLCPDLRKASEYNNNYH
jgi:hypothetical protein